MSPAVIPDRPPALNGADPRDPALPPPMTDQEALDAAVSRDGRIALQWRGGVGVLAALIMSTVALVASSNNHTTAMVMPAPAPTTSGSAAVPGASSAPLISLGVAGSNKRGPDGIMHDSFSTTNFAVKVGQPTRLRINNTDSSPHSITSAEAGVNVNVLPGVHTYTVVATKAGRFEWVCVIPCDSAAHGWAMTHPGYMAGYITAS